MTRLPALLLLVPLWAAAGPHVHGGGKLEGRVDGARLVLELQAPLEDLVGFERRPANDRERAAVESALRYLESGEAFRPDPAARCRLGGASTALAERGRGHVDVTAALVYECAEAKALRTLGAGLFDRFKALRWIEVSILTAKGRARARLTPQNRSLAL